MNGRIAIRLDAGRSIGGGHAMRCIAIARRLRAAGAEVSFLVSDDESRRFLGERGQEAEVIGGDPRKLGAADGALLAEACAGRFQAVLVDSYGVTEAFFDRLSLAGVALCLVDDMYTFERGNMKVPARRDVDIVLNYELFADEWAYSEAYSGHQAKLLIGPRYAPVREEFWDAGYSVSETVGRILVTSGSTNPDHALERMIEGCRRAASSAGLDVVVGGMATFDESVLDGLEYDVHRNVDNMAALMSEADLAVSAAGSTLYELACVGVPTVAVPIVENQVENARGFARRGLGLSPEGLDWGHADLARLIGTFVESFELRSGFSHTMSERVDGRGADRVARCILNCVEGDSGCC